MWWVSFCTGESELRVSKSYAYFIATVQKEFIMSLLKMKVEPEFVEGTYVGRIESFGEKILNPLERVAEKQLFELEINFRVSDPVTSRVKVYTEKVRDNRAGFITMRFAYIFSDHTLTLGELLSKAQLEDFPVSIKFSKEYGYQLKF